MKDTPPHPVGLGTKFWKVSEVARFLRVSKMTVYRLIHAGDLPSVRVGRSYRVPEQAVRDYLKLTGADVLLDKEES